MPLTPPGNPKPEFMHGLSTSDMLLALQILAEKPKKQDPTDTRPKADRSDVKQTRDEAKLVRAMDQFEQKKSERAKSERAESERAESERAKSERAQAAATNLTAAVIAPKPQSLCHHIMPSGRRCRSVRCNQTHYCYFHSGETQRKYARPGMSASYRFQSLPVIEDRASIQIAINEIIRSYISDAIDSRKAGILLYGINIALANLRHEVAPVIAEEDAVPAYDEVPEHDPLARLDDEESAIYAAEQNLRLGNSGGPDPLHSAAAGNDLAQPATSDQEVIASPLPTEGDLAPENTASNLSEKSWHSPGPVPAANALSPLPL